MSMTFTYIAMAASVAGGVTSAVGTYRQGKAAAAAGEANARLEMRNAEQNFWLSSIENVFYEKAAANELAVARAEAAGLRSNAQASANEANAMTMRSRETIKRKREEGKLLLEENRGVFAGNGVVSNTGTALSVLVETVAKQELAVADAQYETNVARANKLYERDIYNYQASTKDFAAGANYGLAKANSKLRKISSLIAYKNGMEGAGMTSAEGRSAQRNASLAAAGQFLSSVGSAASEYRSTK